MKKMRNEIPPKFQKLIRTLFIGSLVYVSLVISWGTAFYLLNGVYKPGASSLPNWGESIYFSAVTFVTIGFGDYLPTYPNGQILVFVESISSIIFIAGFSALIAYQLLKRGQNIVVKEKIYLRLVDERRFFSFRVGNTGQSLVDCKAYMDFGIRRNGVRFTYHKREETISLFEKTMIFGVNLDKKENRLFLGALRKFMREPENSSLRFALVGSDIETGEMAAVAKLFYPRHLCFGGRFVSMIFGGKFDWEKLGDADPLSEEEIEGLNAFLKVRAPVRKK